MAELELRREEEYISDAVARKVGVMAAVLAMLLSVVTIVAHRAHTEAVLSRTEANDQWSHYQSQRVKHYTLELGHDLLTLLPSDRPNIPAALQRYEKEQARHEQEARAIEHRAREEEDRAKEAEKRALRFDIGEGLLEMALVLSSLYFVARRTFFPILALITASGGTLIALSGFLLR